MKIRGNTVGTPIKPEKNLIKATQSITTGSMSFGDLSKAGCKGFYWHGFDFTNNKIQLSTALPNATLSWDKNGDEKTLLEEWKCSVGKLLNIARVKVHLPLSCTLVAVDSDNGIITVDKLPFTKEQEESDLSKYIDSLEFEDCYVANPHSPECGVIELGVGSFAVGSNSIAAGTQSSAVGRDTLAAGNYGHAEGRGTVASYSAHAEGRDSKAIGLSSHAEGGGTLASGEKSHAEGSQTQAIGYAAHAEGENTVAEGNNAHTEGTKTKASAVSSHAEGQNTVASGRAAHAEGYGTVASGDYAHAEGYGTKAIGNQSHAEGYNTEAHAYQAHAEGNTTIAKSQFSHSEGFRTIANGDAQHVQGKYNIEDTDKKYAHIVGNGTSDTKRSNAHTIDWNGNAWFAGDVTVGADKEKLATGSMIKSAISDMKIFKGVGESSIVLGIDRATAATGSNSLAFGNVSDKSYTVDVIGYTVEDRIDENILSITLGSELAYKEFHDGYGTGLTYDISSHCIVRLYYDDTKTYSLYPSQIVSYDRNNRTIRIYRPKDLADGATISRVLIDESCAEGIGSVVTNQGIATLPGSMALGCRNIASNLYAHAEGYRNTACGENSHAEGNYTRASGDFSHTEGRGTIAASKDQHTQGRYNVGDSTGKYAHVVGNGTSEYDRSNAHTLDWQGNAWFAGDVEAKAMILVSPNGKRFKVTVDDNGSLTASALS